ncbi:MAG: DUF916 domain-containing protein [Pseudonocardiales bacterium]
MTTMIRLSPTAGRPAAAQSRMAAAFIVLLTVLLTLVAAAAPAWADPSGQPPPDPPGQPGSSGPATFGVRPATATAPDTRSNFTFGATPGAIIRDFLSVENISEAPLTVRVYASDAFNTPEGGFDVLAGGRKPVDIGAWTVPAQDTVTVGGRSTVIVPFTVTIPQDAAPGDHAGGIVAALTTQETNAEGQRVTVEQRVGARIYARIAGEFKPQLTIDGLSGAYRSSANPVGGGEATVRYTVRNDGNLRLSGAQKLHVKTLWGSTVEFRDLPELPELLPGNSLEFTIPVPDVPPAVWLTGQVLVDPLSISGDQNPALDTVDRSIGFAAIPWVLAGILVVLVLVVLFTVRRRRRRRHGGNGGGDKADRGPTGPVQPTDPERQAVTHAVEH